ncbi:Gins 23 protein [Pyrococcus yayanosii]|nr:Gins 23 protein [Pyrococcus yayanosii]
MLTGKALIPVKVIRSFGSWKEGDMILLEDWKARELWESGVVEVLDEVEKVIGEIDKVISEERKSEPLTPIPEGLYERAEFYIYYLERYIRERAGESVEVINTKMAKLTNLKKKYNHLKELRFKKILEAVRLRPGSMEILTRLSPEERRIYLQMSRIRNEWLGER